MPPVITSREKLRKRLFFAMTPVLSLLLVAREFAIGAEGIRSAHLTPVAAIGRPADTAPAQAANKFEISSYRISGSSGQSVDPYTEQLYRALKNRKGLVSDVEPSDKTLIATLNDCNKGNTFCDVVGVTEEYAEDHMILKLTVWSVPKSHSDLHKARIDGEEHKCNPQHCSRDGCRAALFQDIVEELAGLDRDHKGR